MPVFECGDRDLRELASQLGDCKLIPSSPIPPRPIISEAHAYERHLKLRRQIDATRRHLTPRALGAVRSDRQVHAFAASHQIFQCSNSPTSRRATHGLEAAKRGCMREKLSVSMLAQQHRNVAMPPKVKREGDVLMPKQKDRWTLISYSAGSTVGS